MNCTVAAKQMSDLTTNQEKQFRDYAQLREQVGACTAIEIVKRIRGPGCRQGEETRQAMKSNIKAGKGQKGRKSIGSAGATHYLVGWEWCHMTTSL